MEVAAQNVFDKPNGAFTGEISVSQLKDSNISWTLIGHSERRTILKEEDEFVASKTKTAIDGGIRVILCCGESLEERENGSTVEVVTKQLSKVHNVIGESGWEKVVIAYEPIWAIGTGKVATTGTLTFTTSQPLWIVSTILLAHITSVMQFTDLWMYRTSTRSPRRNPRVAG
jgi:triosephosphate isomerase (TIM)